MNLLLTCREITDNHGVKCDSLESSYVQYFERLGHTVKIISSFTTTLKSHLENIDAIVLTGGGTVPKRFLNEPRNDIHMDERDKLESDLLEFSHQLDIPVLGICRGMQFIAGTSGSVVQKLSHIVPRPHGLLHPVKLKNGQIFVNSFHNDGVYLKNLSKNFMLVALDDENQVVEGIYDPKLKLLGLQWHPEREFIGDDQSQKVSDTIVNSFILNRGILSESDYFSRG